MEKWDVILEYAKNIESLWGVLSLALLMFFIIFFVIWKTNKDIIINMFKKKQKAELSKTLENINEKLNLLTSENKIINNKLELIVKDRRNNKETIEKMLDVQDKVMILLTEKQRIKDFEEKNRIELHNLINNQLIQNHALKTFLVNGLEKGMEFFKQMRSRGLESEFTNLYEDFKVVFKEVRNNINLKVLFDKDIDKSKKFMIDLKTIVIKPNINKFIIDFKELQLIHTNGKLLNKFEDLSELFIFTILKQSIKLYEKFEII
jgi:hypothetical protein